MKPTLPEKARVGRPITVNFNNSDFKEIKKLAKKEGKYLSTCVGDIVREYFKQLKEKVT